MSVPNDPFPSFDLERSRAKATHAYIVGPYLTATARQRSRNSSVPENSRAPEARLAEAEGLARAIELDIAGSEIVPLNEIRPATYLGSGKLEEIAGRLKDTSTDLVVMDCALSPVQQRNLEKELGIKVIDRTGLILEIFGRRARTAEGALQVELAHLAYQRSRLVRSWTHLERQRGGFGFLGGPGETQIEADRRLIQERMARIRKDLEKVKRTRSLHRKKRADVPFPLIALVGYTNAGKSTLFNRLTQSEVMAKDMLFATLDPTLRAVVLPHGAKVMMSDTVGFISDLPTMLISAFRATLEEVLVADVILHVRDISDPESDAQRDDVTSILEELGLDSEARKPVVEVWNKTDLLNEGERVAVVNNAAQRRQRAATGQEIPAYPVSAATGEGVDELLAGIEDMLAKERHEYAVTLEPGDGAGLAWLYENTEVIGRTDDPAGDVEMHVRVAPEREAKLQRRFPQATEFADASAKRAAG